MSWEQAVYQSTLFRGFSYDEFLEVLSGLRGTVRTVKKGAILLDEGELSSFGGVVVSGSLATIKTQLDGAVSILDFLFSSKVFGLDMALTPSKISALSIQSLEDTTVFTFPFSGTHALSFMTISQKERMTGNILTYLANENVRKQHKIEITSLNGLRARILTYLHLMRERHGQNTVTIAYSREQLANYLCVNRSALSHELSRMKREGIIDFKKNKFSLLEERNVIQNRCNSLAQKPKECIPH